jgi:DNA-directed RNA polymerase specialized sigma24 family protein
LLEGYPDYDLHPITPTDEYENDESLAIFTHGRIMDELSNLPDSERDLLLAVHRDHTTYGNLASDLHVPVGTVKSRLFRARRMLRERLPSLAEIYDDSPDAVFAELTAA